MIDGSWSFMNWVGWALAMYAVYRAARIVSGMLTVRYELIRHKPRSPFSWRLCRRWYGPGQFVLITGEAGFAPTRLHGRPAQVLNVRKAESGRTWWLEITMADGDDTDDLTVGAWLPLQDVASPAETWWSTYGRVRTPDGVGRILRRSYAYGQMQLTVELADGRRVVHPYADCASASTLTNTTAVVPASKEKQ